MAMRLLFAGAGLAAAALVAVSAQAVESTYTTLDLDACAVLDQDDETGSVLLSCPGFGDYPVFVAEGDLRMDVDYGAQNGLWQSFASFNAVNQTVEWRVDGDRALATILRYFIDTGDGTQVEALVVSKVANDGIAGCVTAIVDAGIEQANGVARGAAAHAPRFNCGHDRPIAIGPEDGFAFSFTNAIGEGQ